jgi:hypothetical protein
MASLFVALRTAPIPGGAAAATPAFESPQSAATTAAEQAMPSAATACHIHILPIPSIGL